MQDPTEPIRVAASQFPNVDKGTLCTQTSFKAGGTAFLYIGEQGGRFKAMFKLKKSLADVKTLASNEPEDFQIGSGDWITARFSSEKPLPKKIWKKWLDESYAISQSESASKPSAKKRKTSK